MCELGNRFKQIYAIVTNTLNFIGFGESGQLTSQRYDALFEQIGRFP